MSYQSFNQFVSILMCDIYIFLMDKPTFSWFKFTAWYFFKMHYFHVFSFSSQKLYLDVWSEFLKDSLWRNQQFLPNKQSFSKYCLKCWYELLSYESWLLAKFENFHYKNCMYKVSRVVTSSAGSATLEDTCWVRLYLASLNLPDSQFCLEFKTEPEWKKTILGGTPHILCWRG